MAFTPGIFDSAVSQSVHRVLSTMGYKVRKTHELVYIAESERVQLTIAHAWTTVKLLVGLVSGYRSDNVELHWVLEALAPEVGEEDRFPKRIYSDADVAPELQRQLSLLAHHCRELLEGDQQAWTRLWAFMRDFGGLARTATETRRQYAARMFRMADDAWHRKEYWRLGTIYTLLTYYGSPFLRPKDYYRRCAAKRHTFFYR